jgi:dTDP-4-dehydrorhamnose reductase
MMKYINGDNKVIVKEGFISNRIHVEDLSAITIKFMLENHHDHIVNVSDQNIIKNYDAIQYVTNKLQLKEPIIVKYNPEEVSDMLKTFYEVNRIVKSKVIGHHFVYKMKHHDYKKALLELTKKKLKLTNKS